MKNASINPIFISLIEFHSFQYFLYQTYVKFEPFDQLSRQTVVHVFVIIIKSQEKIKPVKWRFLNFNLSGQNFAECKNQDFM